MTASGSVSGDSRLGLGAFVVPGDAFFAAGDAFLTGREGALRATAYSVFTA